MSRSALRKFASRLYLLICFAALATGIQLTSNQALAVTAPPNNCSILFEPVFRKIPQPSKIATAHQDDVMGRASQAVIALKSRRVLPEGQYEVLVHESEGKTRPGILSVKYTLDGVTIALDSISVIRSADVPLTIGADSGVVAGRHSRTRLHNGMVSFISSEFSGNLNTAEGVVRRDTSLEFDITQGRPTTLRLREAILNATKSTEAEPAQQFDLQIELGRKV